MRSPAVSLKTSPARVILKSAPLSTRSSPTAADLPPTTRGFFVEEGSPSRAMETETGRFRLFVPARPADLFRSLSITIPTLPFHLLLPRTVPERKVPLYASLPQLIYALTQLRALTLVALACCLGYELVSRIVAVVSFDQGATHQSIVYLANGAHRKTPPPAPQTRRTRLRLRHAHLACDWRDRCAGVRMRFLFAYRVPRRIELERAIHDHLEFKRNAWLGPTCCAGRRCRPRHRRHIEYFSAHKSGSVERLKKIFSKEIGKRGWIEERV
uniref:Uncharacterized protein n=1 Tax=Mycena chlorophos TaxID=658473 RepID=A0ABQ0KTZ2_MYCCL|nr:predicted protein [Mycena chlorophos]